MIEVRPTARILLVDDNPIKRLALRAILEPLGHVIVEAESGRAALRCCLADDFAVILLDVRMPGMDGFETASLIRQRQQSEMTPIIFITAFASDEIDMNDRYVEGAVDFIFAPVAPDELRAKVTVFANLYLKAESLARRAQEVQTSDDQLRRLTDSAPIGIFQTDANSCYVYTNPRWSEITGIAAEAASGRRWDSIMGTQHGDDLANLGDEVGDRPENSRRFELARPGQDIRVVLVTARPVPDQNGRLAGWVGTLADVTTEVGAEAAMVEARDQATEASRLKSDFLANMSHEVRTPMNGVIGMTDLLLDTALDETQRDYAQTIRLSADALMSIINDILDFSKVEAGKVELEDLDFNLRVVVDNVLSLLERPAQDKGLKLLAEVDADVPPLVRGDPGRVRQVLSNLIGNAIKFTDGGEVMVRVNMTSPDAAHTVRFDVTDTGLGIAPEQFDRIFEPFIQADTSTSRKYGGTGLGLSICRDLAHLMGGDCGVTSRLGEGSNFWFTIRVEAPRPNGDASSTGNLVGVSALIVDDNADRREVLANHLGDWGMATTTAASEAAALAKLRTAATTGRPVAVALVDSDIPDVDGLHLAESIRADSGLDAQVVLMTDETKPRAIGRDADVSATVANAIDPTNLRRCLQEVLARTEDEDTSVEMVQFPARHQPALGRLLLAEDNLVNQKVAVAMLSTGGYHVDAVLNGAAAVKAAARRPYDAILMDCQMPELDGYAATIAIRAGENGGRRTPIIAMTASARDGNQERCLASGMDHFLAKPVDRMGLLSVVATSLAS